jgi:predicted esterase
VARAPGGRPHLVSEPLHCPIESNEPWLTSALDAVGDVVQAAIAAVPKSRILLGGFSQGACLALEFLVRAPARYGAVAGLSGGLIGPPGTVWPQTGSVDGTPVFLGCSDVDFHIPKERVVESADVLRRWARRSRRCFIRTWITP